MPEERDVFRPDRTVARPWGAMSYSDTGGGRPLLLLHGTGRSRLDWEPVLPALQGRRRIRPDLRGHGGSDVPRAPFTIPDLAEDVLALVDALWLGRVDLAGHSLGGLVALACLARASGRIGRVILLESWGSLRLQEEFDPHPFASLPPEARRRVAHMHRETYVQWMPGIRERFWHAIEAFDGLRILRTLTHPVLILLGDRGAPRPAADALGIPRRESIRVEWLPGCGHFPMEEAPAETARRMHRFLRGDDAATETEAPPPPDSEPPEPGAPPLRDLILPA